MKLLFIFVALLALATDTTARKLLQEKKVCPSVLFVACRVRN